ncbi:MAG: cupin [Bacteroidia bacterium]|jgi:uncharacterized protein YjlB
MNQTKQKQYIEKHYLKDDGKFPNSDLPVLVYKGVLALPLLFPSEHIKRIFSQHNWRNAWKNGIFEYHHYHSVTHEVLGVYRGSTTLLLGGENGIKVKIEKGDVLIIPAGVAHKNLDKQNKIKCVGAYPDGKDYDMNYGNIGERPQTDKNIKRVALPQLDPVFGSNGGIKKYWK